MLVLTEAAAEVCAGRPLRQPRMRQEDRACGSHPRPRKRPTRGGALQVTAAPGPGVNDQVIEAAGAHVYLEPQAAAYLDDKVLDARKGRPQGKAHFSLGLQGPGQA